MKKTLLLTGTIFLFAVMAVTVTQAAGFANSQYLIETDALPAKTGKKGVVIVDTRKPEEYADGHIKDAVNLPFDRTQGTINKVPGMMLPVDKLEALLGAAGISADSYIIIYDEYLFDPVTRFFWTLCALGHKKMSVLHGGFNKWVKEGKPMATESTTLAPAAYKAQPDPTVTAALEDVKQSVNKKEVVFLDCRAENEYRGEVNSKDVVGAGHIPGAVWIDWEKNLALKDGFKMLKSPEELLEYYGKAGATPDKTLITYCRTGVRASKSFFVLKLLDYPKLKNYDGSMIEWGNIPGLPLKK